jgi:hypothetical protein
MYWIEQFEPMLCLPIKLCLLATLNGSLNGISNLAMLFVKATEYRET